MFVITEDRFGRLDFGPEKWVSRDQKNIEFIYWPKKDQTLLQRDPNSAPVISGPDKWIAKYDTIKQRAIPELTTVERTENFLDKMLQQSRTENDSESTNFEQQTRKRKKPTKPKTTVTKVPKFLVGNVPKPPSAFKRSKVSSAQKLFAQQIPLLSRQSSVGSSATPPSTILINSNFIGNNDQLVSCDSSIYLQNLKLFYLFFQFQTVSEGQNTSGISMNQHQLENTMGASVSS